VRRVPAASSRLKEASALGFRNVFLPAGNAGEAAAFPDLAAVPIHRVADLLTRVGGNSGGLRRNPEELRRSGAAEGNP